MRQWHWLAISVVCETAAGVAMLMGYRAKVQAMTGDAWDKALVDVTKPSEFSSQNDD